MRRMLLCWLLLAHLLAIGSAPAFAHAGLLNTSPEDGESVQTSPAEVTLTFSEPLEEGLIELKLFDGNGRFIPLAKPRLAAGNAQVEAKLPPLPDGPYTVVWSVVSGDGHPVSGTFSFSVGQAVSAGGGFAAATTATWADRALMALRFAVEGTLLVAAGVRWLSWLFRRQGLPDAMQPVGRWLRPVWLILFLGLAAEGLLYLYNLPGNGLVHVLGGGNWEVLVQSPFLAVAWAQMGLLLLLALPGMVEGWYLAMWALAVAAPAFGGHAWGIQPVWLAVALRVLHLLSLSLWLGALTCLLLTLRLAHNAGDAIHRSSFRRLFVRLAVLATVTLLLSGIAMTSQQTDWTSLWQSGQAWSWLLGFKLVLFTAMLLLALIQTLRWQKRGRFQTRRLLRWEWAAGALAVLAGVCMSQLPYPLPAKPYAKSFQTPQGHVEIHIPRAAPGLQTMTIHFHTAPGNEPQDVQLHAFKTGTASAGKPVPAERTGPGRYQAVVPFTANGSWTYRVDAAFQDGTRVQFTDTLMISGGGTIR